MSQTPAIANNLQTSDANQLTLLGKFQRAFLNRLFNTGGLAIKAGASALAKTVNTIKYCVDGNLASKAAADCAAFSGIVTNAKFNVFVFCVNAAGTFSTLMGTQGDTLADVVFPTIASTLTVVGFAIVNPTGTGNFVGGTTALDDATVVPNVVYVDTVGVAPSLPAMVSL